LNLANKLTISRLFLIPIFIFFVKLGGIISIIIALFIFCLAAITDLLDGKVARKYKTVTYLGTFLDPLADKLLILTAFIYFLSMKFLRIPTWMIIIIAARELLIIIFRLLFLNKKEIMFYSINKTSKIKTIVQNSVAIMIILIIILNEIIRMLNYNLKSLYLINKIPFWLMLIAVIFTIYSGSIYILRYYRDKIKLLY
jgi:CDP-diacylglycerol--glycerol-3-phosphate 3-phosphatidyltransferase